MNLLDKKEVFSYKTALTAGSLPPGATAHCLSASLSNDEISLMFQRFKESFHELVYKFPHTYYLTETCINNCIEYYLQRKCLPCFGGEGIEGVRMLLVKYFSVHQCQNMAVRKFMLEALSRKLHDYKKFDQQCFAV